MSTRYKLVVHVPLENADAVRQAIGEAGGGRLGKYSFCSFSIRGVGRFLAGEGANPYNGEVGKLESAEEERVEVILDEDNREEVITAMKKAHPHEEVAYYLLRLES